MTGLYGIKSSLYHLHQRLCLQEDAQSIDDGAEATELESERTEVQCDHGGKIPDPSNPMKDLILGKCGILGGSFYMDPTSCHNRVSKF
jgi:hypothetical protein